MLFLVSYCCDGRWVWELGFMWDFIFLLIFYIFEIFCIIYRKYKYYLSVIYFFFDLKYGSILVRIWILFFEIREDFVVFRNDYLYREFEEFVLGI